jgi:HEAT repeat protein
VNRTLLLALGIVVLGGAVVGIAWLAGRDVGRPGAEPPETRGPGEAAELPELPEVLDRDEFEAIFRSGIGSDRFMAIVRNQSWRTPEREEALLRMVEDPDEEQGIRDIALTFLVGGKRDDIGERLVDLLAEQPLMNDTLQWRVLETVRDNGDRDQASRIAALITPDTEMPETLWMKVEAVKWLEAPPPVARIRAVLQSDDPVVRGGAGAAMIWAQNCEISPEMDRLLREDESEIFRHEVLRCIADHTGPAGRRYMAKLGASAEVDPELRRMAIQMMPETGDEEVGRVLLDLVAEGRAPDPVLREAANALERAPAEGVARRLRPVLVSGSRTAARVAAADAIRLTADREGLDDVRRALDDGPEAPPVLRAALVRALGEIGGRADRETLRELASADPDAGVREAAETAIRRLDEILMSHPDR